MSRQFASGSSQYARRTSFAGFAGEPFTLGCRFKLVELGTNCILMSAGEYDGSGTYYHALYRYSTSDALLAYTYHSGDYAAAESTVDPVAGVWNHGLAVFASDSSRTVYLNGGNSDTDTVTADVGTDSIAVGASADSTPFGYHNGAISEAIAWKAALNAIEAWLLGKAGVPPWWIRPDAIVAYWPFRYGRTWDRDLSGRGNHLTPANGPTWAPDPPIAQQYWLAEDYRGWRRLGKAPAVTGVPRQMMHYARLRRA